MKDSILKIVLLIFMFLLPISVSTGLIRKEAGKPVFVPTSAYVDYLADYPSHRIDELQLTVSKIKDVYLDVVNYKLPEDKPEPDISINNGVMDYIFGDNFGDRAVNWITNLYEGIVQLSYLLLKVGFDIAMIVIDSLVWALGFIPYILRY